MHTISSPSYIFLCMLKSAVDVGSIHDSYSVFFFLIHCIYSIVYTFSGHPFGHSDSVFQCCTNCHLSHVKSTEVYGNIVLCLHYCHNSYVLFCLWTQVRQSRCASAVRALFPNKDRHGCIIALLCYECLCIYKAYVQASRLSDCIIQTAGYLRVAPSLLAWLLTRKETEIHPRPSISKETNWAKRSITFPLPTNFN